ncbi:3917_t:CDS:2, partial [Gigaspora rosea]
DTGRDHKYKQDLPKHTEDKTAPNEDQDKTIPRLRQRPKKDPTKDERIRQHYLSTITL